MFKTILVVFLLLLLPSFSACKSKKDAVRPETVEEAQRVMAARKAEQEKNAAKIKRQAIKRNLKMQSKPVRKSLKRNAKRNKRRARLIDQRDPLHDF